MQILFSAACHTIDSNIQFIEGHTVTTILRVQQPVLKISKIVAVS